LSVSVTILDAHGVPIARIHKTENGDQPTEKKKESVAENIVKTTEKKIGNITEDGVQLTEIREMR